MKIPKLKNYTHLLLFRGNINPENFGIFVLYPNLLIWLFLLKIKSKHKSLGL